MDPISIAALVLSIVAILLWAYSNLFGKKFDFGVPQRETNQTKENTPEKETISLPAVSGTTGPVQKKQNDDQGVEFVQDIQKFSQMVRKNLEMLNTRVGIKFDIKPISEKYLKPRSTPGYVDSMEIKDKQKNPAVAERIDNGDQTD